MENTLNPIVKPVPSKSGTGIWSPTVLICALGYFVDIYDLLLFGIVRVASLKSIGVPEDQLLSVGISLINKQMTGMLVGGILWGILGDKKGRVSVLFGSILIYSLANIFNGMVTSVEAYGWLRFIAGIGLAGELGAAITLVSETLSVENRGYGTTLVAAIGVLGAVFAGTIGDLFDWRTAYFIGGAMGLVLLVMRISVYESGMFNSVKNSSVQKGDLRMLLSPLPRFRKYLYCILTGVPLWFVVGILMTFSPELAKDLGVTGPISAGRAILVSYLGISVGDLASGYLSQVMKSRRKVLFGFLGLTLVLVMVFLFSRGLDPSAFYLLCGALGFAAGYWAVFMTITAEQFGTNIRATVTTTVPNFVRGSVVLLTLALQSLKGSFGLVQSAWIVGLTTMVLAGISLFCMQETYGKNLDYLEPEGL